MTVLERPSRERPRPPRQRPAHRVARALVVAGLVVLAFLLGIAFARTLDERPEQGRAVTTVRTLTPLERDGPTETVTVTVTSP